MVTDSEADILERVLEAENRELSPEAARFILSLGFRSEDHERIAELADRSNEGTLSESERSELEMYNRVRLLLIKLKSRARLVLGAPGVSGNGSVG